MLPMLTVTGVPGLLYLNGRLCGETGMAAMPLSPDGVQYLELRPFDCGARGAVLRLRIERGVLREGLTGDVYAVQWPGGFIAMEMRGAPGGSGTDARDVPPRLLSSIAMPGGVYLLVDEGGVPSFGRDSREALFLPVEGITDGRVQMLPYPGLCAAEGSAAGCQYAAVLRADGAPEIVCFAKGSSARVDGQGVIHCVEPLGDFVRHTSVRTIAPDAYGDYREVSRELSFEEGAPRWPASPEDTARAWLEALLLGAHEEAAGYLLNPMELPRFQQTVGAYDAVAALPERGASGVRLGVLAVTGENLAIVREIVFTAVPRESAQGSYKIESVSEGICD